MTNSLKHTALPALLIALVSALIFIPFIGNCPLFDWDEVNFAECAREMIVSGNYSQVQLNFRPFWEKPPLFIWFQVLSMKLFGINEFAARFPNAVCGIATLVILFLIGTQLHSRKLGYVWIALYACSLLPHFYFKTGIIDPWFNLFILLSVFYSFRFLNEEQKKRSLVYSLMAGLFLGSAVLTKGPVALLLVAVSLLVFLALNKQLKLLFSPSFIVFSAFTLLVSSSWFIIEWLKGNADVFQQFIDYQLRLAETKDAGHGGPFFYHFVVLLLGCFPSSLLFIASYTRHRQAPLYPRLFGKLLIVLFWVVLLLFSVVKTKIIHYSSLCYFPLTFVAAIGIVDHFSDLKFNTGIRILYCVCSAIIGLLALAIGLFKFIKTPLLISGLIKDEFAVQNLGAYVEWTGWEFLIGLCFIGSAALIYRALVQKQIKLLYYGLFLNLVFIASSIMVIVPKIELYTQRAAIEFFRSCANQNCYVETHGFKSYAYLFYSNRRPEDYTNKEQGIFVEHQLDVMVKEGHSRIRSFAVANQLWMEHGVVDRPAYLVAKKQVESELLRIKGMSKLYELNGFTFFVRMPVPSAK